MAMSAVHGNSCFSHISQIGSGKLCGANIEALRVFALVLRAETRKNPNPWWHSKGSLCAQNGVRNPQYGSQG